MAERGFGGGGGVGWGEVGEGASSSARLFMPGTDSYQSFYACRRHHARVAVSTLGEPKLPGGSVQNQLFGACEDQYVMACGTFPW